MTDLMSIAVFCGMLFGGLFLFVLCSAVHEYFTKERPERKYRDKYWDSKRGSWRNHHMYNEERDVWECYTRNAKGEFVRDPSDDFRQFGLGRTVRVDDMMSKDERVKRAYDYLKDLRETYDSK